MSTETTRAQPGGVGFFGLLTIVFVTLKLTHYIDWSWWLVLAPLWGSVLLFLVTVLVVTVAEAWEDR